MKKIFTARVITISSMILLASLSRLLPHPFNFTPIGAMALFGGAYISNRFFAYAIPFFCLIIGDVVMGLGNPLYAEYLTSGGFFAVYSCFIFITWLGTKLQSNTSALRVGMFSIISSVAFFVFSNFLSWLGIGMNLYPLTIEGLILCYVNAIPFFSTTLFGDLFYATVVFGLFYIVQVRFPQLARVNG